MVCHNGEFLILAFEGCAAWNQNSNFVAEIWQVHDTYSTNKLGIYHLRCSDWDETCVPC